MWLQCFLFTFCQRSWSSMASSRLEFEALRLGFSLASYGAVVGWPGVETWSSTMMHHELTWMALYFGALNLSILESAKMHQHAQSHAISTLKLGQLQRLTRRASYTKLWLIKRVHVFLTEQTDPEAQEIHWSVLELLRKHWVRCKKILTDKIPVVPHEAVPEVSKK